ncbi:MAG TPA: S8 family serine peptidase [Candidatus Cloacimonadota bacterium]|nr:S8 family serine peptidase [Candidatus Cloacimonadota bacterium]
MKKTLLILTICSLLISCIYADSIIGRDKNRPKYASDRILIKLSSEAAIRSRLPQGLYAEAKTFNIPELDRLMIINGGETIIRAHRKVKDRDWEAKTGFDRWFIIKLNGKVSVENALQSFKSNSYIETATPEYIAYTTEIPTDTYYANNWGHNNTAQLPVWSESTHSHSGAGVGIVGFDSDAQLAWNQAQGYGSPGTIIAILDTGVDTSHPDLRLVTGYDFGDGDSNPMDNSADPGHGTCCAGIAAAIANNSLGVAGIAGGCSVMPLKVANSGGYFYSSAISNALTFAADYGADVISMSFGAAGVYEGVIPSEDDALYYAYNNGVVLFAATANDNAAEIDFPANHTAVIAVGAASPSKQRKSPTSSDGESWWGSNYGSNNQDYKTSVDIMGPTILPTTDLVGSAGYSSTDYYMWFNGTSCATPYVAGVAALVLSKNPLLSPAEVRSALTTTATDMTSDGGTGWDKYTGYGMVNANGALNASYNIWDGSTSTAWSEPTNWSKNTVPTNADYVEIPGSLTRYPVVTAHQSCKSLLVLNGASVTINIGTLNPAYDCTIYGNLIMDDANGHMYVGKDLYFQSGSTANISAAAEIYVFQNVYFMEGCNVNMANGSIVLYGSTHDSYIYTYENVAIYSLISFKQSGRISKFGGSTSKTVTINGNIIVEANSTLSSTWSSIIYMKGSLYVYPSGVCTFDAGNLIFVGSGTSSISFVESGTNNHLYHLRIYKDAGSSVILSYPLTVKNTISINSGTFNANSKTIYLGGSWANFLTEANFTEGTGTLVINGSGNQTVCSETFYNIELNKTGGELIIPLNNTVSCSSFDWTAGSYRVDGGHFIVGDLVDDGILGTITLNSGSIDYTQGTSQYIDLRGNLTILGGTFTVHGGLGPCYFSYTDLATLTMDGGTLDFKDVGVYVAAGWPFTDNISGGTIRTALSFDVLQAGFNPTGGTVELYGTGLVSASLVTGSNFYNLIINKAASRDFGDDKLRETKDKTGKDIFIKNTDISSPSYGLRTTHVQEMINYRTDGVTVNSYLTMQGNLTITAGIFDLNGYTVETVGNVNVTGNVKMASSACILLCGGNMTWNSGCTTTVSAGTIQCWGNWTFNTGSAAQLTGTTVQLRGTGTHTLTSSSANSWFYTLAILPGTGGVYNYTASSSVLVWNNLTISSGTLSMLNSTTLSVANDLAISSGAGLNTGAGSNVSIVLGRNWTDANTSYNESVGFNPGTSTITLTGSQVQTVTPSATAFNVYNMIINKTVATNEVHFTKPVTALGDCAVQQGIWMDNTNALTHTFYKSFGVAASGTFAGGTYLNTVNFAGSDPGTLIFIGNGSIYGLSLNKTSVSGIVTMYSAIYCLGGATININVGTLNLASYLCRTTGNINVGNGGKISVGPDGSFEVADTKTLAVNSGGIFESLGSSGHLAKVTHQSGLFYFNINSGGTISSEWTLFEYMSTGGVYVKTGALVSTIHSFHHCTFQNGGSALALLVINSDQTITINDPIFPTNTWSGTWNVRKTVDAGTVNIYNATGGFAGVTYEGDNYARINWYASIPDVVITGYSLNNSSPVIGSTIYYTATVTNNTSSAISTQFRVGLYYNAESQPAQGTTPDKYVRINSLAAGASVLCEFSGTTNSTLAAWHSYFRVDYTGVITESDENNNGYGPLTVNWQTLPIISPPTITKVSNTVIRLDWTYGYTVTRYKIYRSTNPYSGFTQVGTSTNKYYQETAAEKYFYYVTAEL